MTIIHQLTETMMKRTFLTLALAAQLVAGTALAQTTDNTTASQPEGSGMTTTYGGDWSTSLGSALFGEDGTTVRSSTEIGTQWSTLSETDKQMIRRDCMAHMQMQTGTSATGDAADTAAKDTTTTTGDAGSSGTSGTAESTAADAATTKGTISVTMEQMEQICAATKDL